MGKDKDKTAPCVQQPKMDRYTVPAQRPRTPDQSQPPETSEPDKFKEILAAIQASRCALEGQIGGVQSEVALVRQDLRNVVDRVTEAEGRVSEVEDSVKELRTTVQRLSAKTGVLEQS